MKYTAPKIRAASEHEIQTMCNNYLRFKGWYVIRLNSGRIPLVDARGKRRLIMLNEPGTPDTIAFKPCAEEPTCTKTLFIEYKRVGGVPTALQTAKMKDLAMYGATCIIATGIDDIDAALKKL